MDRLSHCRPRNQTIESGEGIIMTTYGPQTIRRLPTFTDEKLEEYLSIWRRLKERGYKKLEITLQMDYRIDRLFSDPWSSPWIYMLSYGEERRELTYEQAVRVKQWFGSLNLQAIRA